MRAVVVPAYGGPDVLSVQDVPEPQPGPGEVSVAVRFAGVNYTDVRNRKGDGLGVTPFIPGVEVAGTVRAVGAGVTSLRPGQPVAAFTRGHGYAEVATASEAFTVPLPDVASFGRLVSYSNISGEPETAPDAGWLRARCIGYIGFSAGQLSGREPGVLRPALEEAVALVPPVRSTSA